MTPPFLLQKPTALTGKKTILAYLFFPALLFCNILAAQPLASAEPHHKVAFENKYIRLLEGHIAAHDTAFAHVHAANGVVIFLSKSTFAIQLVGQKPVISVVNPGDMKYVAYGDKPVTHLVWNQSDPMFHFYVVELSKQHPAGDTCPILSQPDTKFQWSQKSVSAYYIDIAKSGKYKLPKSNCAYFLIDVSGAVTTASSGDTHSLESDGFQFFSPQKDIEINSGNKENARCILLQLN
jgi:hypothetical protein